jgi:hypothetical protein
MSAPESPAAVIRRAAALMRERAEGCETRGWHWEALGEKRYPQRISADGNLSVIAETFIDPAHRPYEAEHIASWSPPIALAVADWLDDEAGYYDTLADTPYGAAGAAFVAGDFGGDVDPAVKVARAYLGEPPPAGDEAGIDAVKRAGMAAWDKQRGGVA